MVNQDVAGDHRCANFSKALRNLDILNAVQAQVALKILVGLTRKSVEQVLKS